MAWTYLISTLFFYTPVVEDQRFLQNLVSLTHQMETNSNLVSENPNNQSAFLSSSSSSSHITVSQLASFIINSPRSLRDAFK